MAFKIKLKPSAGASASASAGKGAAATAAAGATGESTLLAPPKVRLKLAPLGARAGEGAPAAAAGSAAGAGGEAQATPRITIKQGGGLKLLLKPGKVAKRAVPRIRVKPTRIPGEGFDSEAPDREDDPLIEDAVIVRFTDEVAAKEPGAFAFLDKALESGDMLGVSVKWRDARRAVVMVHGVLLGGKLLDLPTVVEIHKLLDRKTLFKNMDVCQVLLVTDVLAKEDDISDPTLRFNVYRHDYYPHGITPPMRQARRRFRKRVLNKVIELVENQVEQLLMADEEALELPDYELVDPHTALAAATPYEEEEEPLVEGATPAAGDEAEEIDENALEAELEEALAEEGGDDDDEAGDEDDDGEDDDDEDDDDEDEDLSPEAVQLRQEKTRLRQEIRDMEQTVTRKQEQLRHGLVVVGHNANSELHKVQELLEAKRMQLALVEDRAAQPDNKGVLQAVGEEEEEEDDDDDDDMDDLF